MKISVFSQLSLAVMLDVAYYSNNAQLCPAMGTQVVRMKDIAERLEISRPYLVKIMDILNQTDFFEVVRGKEGGIKLARAPKDYTIAEIFQATDTTLLDPPELSESTNQERAWIDQHITRLWNSIDDSLTATLSKITLADLLTESKDDPQLSYQI